MNLPKSGENSTSASVPVAGTDGLRSHKPTTISVPKVISLRFAAVDVRVTLAFFLSVLPEARKSM
jgi:hypothetical protein